LGEENNAKTPNPIESHSSNISEEIEMVGRELAKSVAYCGLICGICKNVEKGCIGCRSGGGDDDCYQRNCCLKKGISGCWLCDGFPCDMGYFADEAWAGLCKGFVQCIKAKGIEELVQLARTKLGEVIEYGDLRFKTEEEIVVALCGT